MFGLLYIHCFVFEYFMMNLISLIMITVGEVNLGYILKFNDTVVIFWEENN